MSDGEIIIVVVRLVGPLLILRSPLVGGVLAMVLDALDVVLIDAIGLGGFGGHYAELDKALDSYYLTLELILSLGWRSSYARWPAVALYIYRLIGVVLFETTHTRVLLLVFANVFENWWLYCVATARFWPRLYPTSLRSVAVPLVLLLIPKIAQEYVLHYAEVHPWNWIRHHVLRVS